MSVTIRKGLLLGTQHKCWPLYMSCLQVVMTPDFSMFSQCMTPHFSGDITNNVGKHNSFSQWSVLGTECLYCLPDILQTKMSLSFCFLCVNVHSWEVHSASLFAQCFHLVLLYKLRLPIIHAKKPWGTWYVVYESIYNNRKG